MVAWVPMLWGKWVSDDWQGVDQFSDKFDQKTKKLVVEYGDKKKYKNTQFNPDVGFPGSVIRWFRINVGKTYKKLGSDEKGHDLYGYAQDPFKHHLLSLFIHAVNTLLVYLLIFQLFGLKLAVMATVLFVVHPVSCQAVAWISGIGYLTCLLGASASYLTVLNVENLYLQLPLVLAFSVLSQSGLFCGSLNWIILLYLGHYPAAIVSFICFLVFGIKLGKKIVNLRVSEFKKQNMEKSTVVHWRKLVVMAKTLWYYVRLVVFPKRLGLFHKWGYHYDDAIEKVDFCALAGFVVGCVLLSGLFLGVPVISFAILWCLVYYATFSNFITAMQFVADRYAFLPSLGYSLILAHFLQDYPALWAFLVGLYLCRTWVHIPTFDNEISFYRSNIWNFPDSEVAWGNMGVTYMHRGMAGTAVDCWNKAIHLNKHYDVPHYNLYSIMKSNGQFEIAVNHLRECLNAKTVHFKEAWEKEMKQINTVMELRKPLDHFTKQIRVGMGVFK